jgi:hypothetical protein
LFVMRGHFTKPRNRPIQRGHRGHRHA